jgi:anti-anti-sigma regulatory factor
MTIASRGTLSIEVPDPATYVIRASGEFDRSAGARLLRLVDARLQLVTVGSCATRHMLVDLTAVDAVHPAVLVFLRHAQHGCRRRDVSFFLVGTGALTGRLPMADRADLLRYRQFPSVDAALAELAPGPDATAS